MNSYPRLRTSHWIILLSYLGASVLSSCSGGPPDFPPAGDGDGDRGGSPGDGDSGETDESSGDGDKTSSSGDGDKTSSSGDGDKTSSSGDGDSGTGGNSNAGKECDADDDCDDGLFCNGVEACDDDGSCVVESAFSCSADLDVCSANCEEGDDEAVCIIEALDNDVDGAGSMLCTEADEPGEDCDDDNENTYPGATDETCDGIDADCDGIADIDAGRFNLSGTATKIEPPDWAYLGIVSDVTYAYSPDSGKFLIVSNSPQEYTRRSVLFDGRTAGSMKDMNTAQTGWSVSAPGPGGFGVLSRYEDFSVAFSRIDENGDFLGPVVELGQADTFNSYAIAGTSTGYLVGYPTASGVLVEHRSETGAVRSPVLQKRFTDGVNVRVANAGDRNWVFRTTADGELIASAMTNDLINVGEDITVSSSSDGSSAGTMAVYGDPERGELLMAWSVVEGDPAEYHSYMAVLDNKGNTVCAATPVTRSSLGSGNKVAITSWIDGGYLMASIDSQGLIVLTRFSSNCEKVGDPKLVWSTVIELSTLTLVGDVENGYLIAWLTASGNSSAPYYRRFGANLCD